MKAAFLMIPLQNGSKRIPAGLVVAVAVALLQHEAMGTTADQLVDKRVIDNAVAQSGGNIFTLGNDTKNMTAVVTIEKSNDFNGDGWPDILLQNATGDIGWWSMNGEKMVAGNSFTPRNVGPNWKLIGHGDFDGDRHPDLLFQYPDGTLATWIMDGTIMRFATYFGPTRHFWSTGPNWNLIGAHDVNQDAKPDLIFQHTGGDLATWIMNGTNVVTTSLLSPKNPGRGWKAFGAGDFYGNGKWQLVFQHDNDFSLGMWDMNGVHMVASHKLIPEYTIVSWGRAAGVADLDGDGKPDILIQSIGQPTGSFLVRFMDGFTRKGYDTWLAERAPGWSLAGPKDIGVQ